ncbi:MAG TPA: sigma-70 family RNA polymerase sigma factor [Vicinamibacteria bacterium]
MASSVTDHALLDAARRGDRSAIEALLERHQARIYRFGMKMCGSPEDARDVLQETLLAMARSVRDFREESSVSTWLYSIARGFCAKKRRKSKFAPDVVRSLETDVPMEAGRLPDTGRRPDELLASKELLHALEEAIDSLDPMSREVLLLRDSEGLTAPDVAEVLGVSVDAVKSRLHRARLAVRSAMAPLVGPSTEEHEPARGRCPDVLSLYSRHLEGEIDSELCTQMERHIAACARCRASCDSLKRVLSLCASVPAEPVPESVQDSVRAEVLKALPASL